VIDSIGGPRPQKEIDMENFRIEIEAVGGHGCDRDTEEGKLIKYQMGHTYLADGTCPDCNAKAIAERFAASSNLVSAKLIHWPDTTPIVDDLRTGTREHGDFHERWQGEELLKHFPHMMMTEGPARDVARAFGLLAFTLVRTVPRSPERTVALRKLLEGCDAAIRAARPGAAT
jgi:hypothetical protein